MQAQKLSALQLELLKVYSFQPKEEDLIAIKKLMAQYFADKLRNKIWLSIPMFMVSLIIFGI